MTENWTPKNSPPELSDADAELLSAYLDKMLSTEELTALETRLADDTFLRQELAAMQQTVAWLNTMPRLKAPRDFRLKESDIKTTAPKINLLPSRRNFWQTAGAAAAVFVVLFFAATLLPAILNPAAPNPAASGIAFVSTQSPSEDLAAKTEENLILAQPTMSAATANQAQEASNSQADDSALAQDSALADSAEVEEEAAPFNLEMATSAESSDAPMGGGLDNAAARSLDSTESADITMMSLPQAPEASEEAEIGMTVFSAPVEEQLPPEQQDFDSSMGMGGAPSFGERWSAFIRGLSFVLEALSQ